MSLEVTGATDLADAGEFLKRLDPYCRVVVGEDIWEGGVEAQREAAARVERKRLRAVARRREEEEERAFIEAEVNVGSGGKVEEVDTTTQATGRSRDAFGHVITGMHLASRIPHLSLSLSLSLSLWV